MKCEKCLKNFPEHKLDLSHDIPCYLFIFESGNRKQRKPFADKYPRRYLCKDCHAKYERRLRDFLIQNALIFSYKFFGNDYD